MKIKKKQANGSTKPMLFLWMTRTVNLLCVLKNLSKYKVYSYVASEASNAVSQTSNFTIWLQEKRNLCVMTGNVNLPSVFICGQQWNQVTKPSHMQLPKPAMKQSTYKKFNQDDKKCQSDKNIVLKSVQWDQCVMTRTVNLPSLCVVTRNVKWNLKGHNLLICGQCQRLLVARLVHSLK